MWTRVYLLSSSHSSEALTTHSRKETRYRQGEALQRRRPMSQPRPRLGRRRTWAKAVSGQSKQQQETSARAKAGCMQHRCFAASGLLPLVLIEMLIVAAALLAIGSSLTATIRGIVLSATVQADPLRGRRPSVPSSAHGSQQATSMGWRQVRGIRPSNVWTPLHRKPAATYRVEYNAVPGAPSPPSALRQSRAACSV